MHVNSTEKDLMATLALMTDMLKNPIFDATELEKLKTQDLASLEENKSEPQAMVIRQVGLLNNNYPKGHPNYTMTYDEEVAAIKAITVEAIKDYYKDFYGISDTASVVAIGNMDEAALKSYFEKEYSSYKNDKPYTKIANSYKVNKHANEQVLTPDKKNAVTFGVLSFEASQNDVDFAALQVAGEILGGGFLNSRVATRLRQKDGVSYGVGAQAQVDDDKKDNNSMLWVYAIYNPENAAKVQQGFKEEIARFIKDGITEDELKNVVNGWVQEQSVSRAKDNELARKIGDNMYYDRDMNFQKGIEARVKSLTVADVNKVIKKSK